MPDSLTRGRASPSDGSSDSEGWVVTIVSGWAGGRVNGGNEEQVGTSGCRAGAQETASLSL